METGNESFCALCGRREHQVKQLAAKGHGFICDDCQNLQMEGTTEAALMRVRDPSINDPYQRFKLETQLREVLRTQFATSIATPRDPEEPKPTGQDAVNGFKAHPVLQDKVQFSGVNENMKLPNMDPEQWENYLQNELDYQNRKRLQKLNEQSMRPSR